jgi:hypothetical protein
MAEQQQQIPTFKLVLVGDGGTGKVCAIAMPLILADHLCEATLDGRV